MCAPAEYTSTRRMVAPASSKMLLRSPCPSLWCSRTFTSSSSERYILAEEFFLPPLKLVVSLPPRSCPGVFTASWEVTGVLYRGGVMKLHARGFFARRRRENVGDVDCKSLHLCTEIDATHTLLTTTNEYAVPTTTMTH